MLTSSPDGPYESRQSVPTHWIGIVTCSHVLLILAKPKRIASMTCHVVFKRAYGGVSQRTNC